MKKIINVFYEGKCPECGWGQLGKTEDDVDVLCQTCRAIKNIDSNSDYPSLQAWILRSGQLNVEYVNSYRKIFDR